MIVAERTLAERVVALAEARLGRELTAGERHIDLLAGDAALERGKKELEAAIAAEYDRAVNLAARGRVPRLELTERMVAVLERLTNDGARHARAELRSMGIEPLPPAPRGVMFADELGKLRRADAIRPTLGGRMRALLDGIRVRVVGEFRAATISGEGFEAVARALKQRHPGALDMASRLVSSAYIEGVGRIYEDNQDLFGAWQYSAVMDAATCDVCRALDGTVYATLDELLRVLPNFGPNPSCFGDGRCRCRGMPAPPDSIPPDRATTPPPAPPLPADLTEVQIDYQNRLAFRLNEKLRKGSPLTDAEARAVELLDAAFVPSKAERVLWRGLPDWRVLFPDDQIRRGRSFTNPGYTSTSLDIDHADIFATGQGGERNLMIRITLPKGSGMQRLAADETMDQAEVLLPRGTTFTVEDITIEDGLRTVHVRALTPEPTPTPIPADFLQAARARWVALDESTLDEIASGRAGQPYLAANGYSGRELLEREAKLRVAGAEVKKRVDELVEASGVKTVEQARAAVVRAEKAWKKSSDALWETRESVMPELLAKHYGGRSLGQLTMEEYDALDGLIASHPTYRAAADKHRRTVVVKLERARVDEDDAEQKIVEARQKAIRGVLGDAGVEVGGDLVVKPLPMPTNPDRLAVMKKRGWDFSDVARRRAMENVSAVARFLPSRWIDASNRRGDLYVTEKRRGVYIDRDYDLSVSGVRGSVIGASNQQVALHEMGHRIEAALREVGALAWTFRLRRTVLSSNPENRKLEKLKDLHPGSRYRDNEVTYKDEFRTPYYGRTYGDTSGDGTEILAKGLEALIYGREDLWDKDPELRDFLLGLLAIFG